MPTATVYSAHKGTSVTFNAPAHLTLLQAAEASKAAAATFASSCRNGICRTCICQLIDGDVHYQIPWPGLSVDEKRDKWILACVAYPLTDVVIRRLA